jgi:hypothetical protein
VKATGIPTGIRSQRVEIRRGILAGLRRFHHPASLRERLDAESDMFGFKELIAFWDEI